MRTNQHPVASFETRTIGKRFKLTVAALTTAVMLVGTAACSGGVSGSADGETSTASASGAYKEAKGGDLHVYTWADYMPNEVIKAYEKATGTKLTVDYFESNESLEAKLQASNGAGYDIVMPSDYMVKQLDIDNLLLHYNTKSLPNAKNIKTEYSSPYYDPKLEYSAPYIPGFTGFLYDSTVVSGNDVPKTWNDYFHPAAAFGKTSILDDQVEITNSSLRAVGADQCSTDPSAYQKASELLSQYKSRVGVVSSDGTPDRLASGEQKIGMAWSTEAYQAMVDNPKLKFVFPTDGTTQYVDNIAIPKGAENVDQAKTFINFMLDPKNKTLVEKANGASSVLKGGDALLPAEMKKQNAVVPSEAEIKTLRMEKQCSNKINNYYSKLYEDFRH